MRLVHRAHTSATPSQVWQVLGDPRRWPEFDLSLRKVRGSHGRAAAGDHLLGLSRPWSLRIPLDVVEAVPGARLVLRVHVAPGVTQQVTTEVAAALRGGSDLTCSVVVEGLFARAAVVPLYVASGVTVRVLAARADREARAARTGAA